MRVPRRVMDEARAIAEREDESQAEILRRLLRRGLERERRDNNTHSDEAA